MRSKQQFNVSECHARVLARFSGRSNSIYNIIYLVKKMYMYNSYNFLPCIILTKYLYSSDIICIFF